MMLAPHEYYITLLDREVGKFLYSLTLNLVTFLLDLNLFYGDYEVYLRLTAFVYNIYVQINLFSTAGKDKVVCN